MPEEIARRNLSHNLTHLRRSLPIPETVVSIGNRVWLEPELVWCDVIQFINLEREPQHKDSDFRRAINLYRGSFLEGFDLPGSAEFEHWCLVKRTGLERLYLDALGFMIDYCTSHWEITSAIQFARRYLEIDELAETVHRRLIALYAATGDRHAAMKQYEFCSGVLERELGVVPLPETLQIYQAVLRGSPHFPKPGQGKHVPGLPEMDLPPVGREL